MQTQNEAIIQGFEILQGILETPSKSDLDVARGISIIEDYAIEISSLESLLKGPSGNQVTRIGITGAPGVGKSTFLNMILASQNLNEFKIAVIAIDPSSRTTNGAVLGDRIRITQNSIFEKIYFRSMATRGAYGGLNKSIESVLFFLGNCGFNLIFVETVGVGQNEVEIASCVDLVVHILDSNSGDEVQLEKAGVMEVGDIYFVNKRDNNVSNKFVTSLKSFVSNINRVSRIAPVVIVGSAISGEGLEEVINRMSISEITHQSRRGEH